MCAAGVVHAHGHHVDVARRGDLGREQGPRIDVRHPVEMFLVVFHRIDAVEGEGREERDPHDRFAQGRHAGRVLVAQQVAAQAGLRPLGILELDDPRPLDRLLADAEQPGGHLRDHVVLVGDEPVGIAALAGAGEAVEGLGDAGLAQQHADVGRTERHAAAVPGDVDLRSSRANRSAGSTTSEGRDVLAPQAGGRGLGEAEPQAVEPAARGPDLALEVLARRRARLRHFPVAHQQVGRPAIVAHRFEDRIDAKREGLLRTGVDAIRAALDAVRADATVVEGADDGPIALGPDVDPVLADLDASAARRAVATPGERCTCRSRSDTAAGPARAARETSAKSACARNRPLGGSVLGLTRWWTWIVVRS